MQSLPGGVEGAELAAGGVESSGLGLVTADRGADARRSAAGPLSSNSDGSGARLWNNLFKRSNMFSWRTTLTPGSEVVDIIQFMVAFAIPCVSGICLNWIHAEGSRLPG
jgi:hypothetical protein